MVGFVLLFGGFFPLNLDHTQQVTSNFHNTGGRNYCLGARNFINCFAMILQLHPQLSSQQRLHLKIGPLTALSTVAIYKAIRKMHGYVPVSGTQKEINSNNMPWKAIKHGLTAKDASV